MHDLTYQLRAKPRYGWTARCEAVDGDGVAPQMARHARQDELRVSGMKQPDPSPAVNCNAGSVGRFGDNGRMSFDGRKDHASCQQNPPVSVDTAAPDRKGSDEHLRSRLGRSYPRPSSSQREPAPRMSARPNVDSLPVRVEIKVPQQYCPIPSHGIGAACGAGAITDLMRSPTRRLRRSSSAPTRRSPRRIDGRNDPTFRTVVDRPIRPDHRSRS